MAIIGLAILGYLAGLVGTIVGSIVPLMQAAENDRKSPNDKGGWGFVILLILTTKIFTSAPIQAVKVLTALIAACLLSGTPFAWLSVSFVCFAVAGVFVMSWPTLARMINRK